jgi:hypothetical protein
LKPFWSLPRRSITNDRSPAVMADDRVGIHESDLVGMLADCIRFGQVGELRGSREWLSQETAMQVQLFWTPGYRLKISRTFLLSEIGLAAIVSPCCAACGKVSVR